ncbi:MAG TPA: ABC transporter permease [Pseudonocardiaceae bacterium]|nr:ABC transporter permease [Pseudonocardiaceae bacterium]
MTLIIADDPAAHPPTGRRPEPPAPVGRGRLVLRRLLRNKLAVSGAVVVVLLYLLAFSYSWYWPWNYTMSDSNAYLSPPTGTHWFGTDKDGIDMYAQVLRGLQKSLTIGLLVGVISTSLAAIVGSVAGYFRGIGDRVLMWLVDLLLILPNFLILSVLSPSFRGRSWLIFVALIAAFSWMITARIVRGMTMSLREREFVTAARLMGVPAWKVIGRHILPQLSSLLIADATVNVAVAILTEASLSYFGFGIQLPDVSLGTLIAGGTGSAVTFPWLFFIPAGFLVLTVLAINLLGDGLRDALDANSGRAHRHRRKNAR